MRILFFAFILFATGCSGQTAGKQTKIDTAKLFDPVPYPKEAPDAMFKNSIVLFQQNYNLVHNGTEQTFDKLEQALDHIEKNAALIRQKKFYLIIDSNTKFDKTVVVINVLKKNKIDNYKVINYQAYFKRPEPVTIQTPTTTISEAKPFDSTYFSITVLDNGYEAKLANKKTLLKTTKKLDDFIKNNQTVIDSDKILIVSNMDTPYEKFKPIPEVFKKYGYFKFKLVNN